MELNVVERSDTFNHIALKGRLDTAGAAAIELKFLGHTASQQCNTIVDLSEVPFIASMGMGMFINAAKALARRGVKLVLLAPQPLVEGALRNGRMADIIDIVHTVDEAKQLFDDQADQGAS